MKYIVFETCEIPGFDHIGLSFPDFVQHKDFARHFPTWIPVSAGFVKFEATCDGDEQRIITFCFGESESLKIKSDPNDSDFFPQ